MMPSLAEILSSISGAFRLFLFDTSGYEHFNFSREGFWRSFFVVLLIAPIYFWIAAVQYRVIQAWTIAPLPPLTHALTLAGAIYIVYWLLIPWLLWALSHLLGVSGRYLPFVVVFNWSALVIVALEALPFALFAVGVLPMGLVRPLFFASIVAGLVYRTSLARMVLGVSMIASAGVAFSDLLIVGAISMVMRIIF